MNKISLALLILCIGGCIGGLALLAVTGYSSRKNKDKQKVIDRPLCYYKQHVVVGIWSSKNTVLLANDSTYCTVRVTDYEITTISLGDTIK